VHCCFSQHGHQSAVITKGHAILPLW